MSNSRQFMVPMNYDITKQVYSAEEVVQKRTYSMDGVISGKKYQKLYIDTKTENGISLPPYVDKLRRRAKFR